MSPEDLFAQAPPTGGAVVTTPTGHTVLGVVEEKAIKESERRRTARPEVNFRSRPEAVQLKKRDAAPAPDPRPTTADAPKKPSGGRSAGKGHSADGDVTPGLGGVAANRRTADSAGQDSNNADPITNLARQLQTGKKKVVVEGFAGQGDADKNAAALARANRLREQLIANDVAPIRSSRSRTSTSSAAKAARAFSRRPRRRRPRRPPPAPRSSRSGRRTASPRRR